MRQYYNGIERDLSAVNDPPKDWIHLFDLEETLGLVEVSRKTLAKLCRKGKLKPVSGRGESRQYSFVEINRLNELKKSEKGYTAPKVSCAGYCPERWNPKTFYGDTE